MVSRNEFLQFAAETLGVDAATLTMETSYGELAAWDSMAHLRLVMEIGRRYGVSIPFSDITRVRSLWEFWRRVNGAPVKKVIAIDLDNTLWQGVVGEGEEIIPDVGLQTRLKMLRERGILLAALSKNNPEDVDWFFADQPAEGCVLCGRDFVARRINWESKAENLLQIAAELNLGTDAFVFIDDNPAERLEMQSRLPEVEVAEFPSRVEAYFPERELTVEDRTRTEEYRAEAARRELAAKCNPEEFLKELQIRTDIHRLREDEVARVAQLSQKANQFNVCTNRYTEDELRRIAADDTSLIVTAHASDRFGDQGLIAYVIVKCGEIIDWVMSCRAMGRGIEDRVEAAVEAELRARGVRELRARWQRTARNRPVEGLFERFGFSLLAKTDAGKQFLKRLALAAALFVGSALSLSAARIDSGLVLVTEGDDAKTPEVGFTATTGNAAVPFEVVKSPTLDWLRVEPSSGTLPAGKTVDFKIDLDTVSMTNRHEYRGVFFIRTTNGLSRAVSVAAEAVDYVPPMYPEKPGMTAIYADLEHPSSGSRLLGEAEYVFDVAVSNKYYFMIHGAATSKKYIDAAVDDDEYAESPQQVKSYPSWTMIAPGRDMFSGITRPYELGVGRHRLRVKVAYTSFPYDGIVLTDDPDPFEQR